MTDNEKIIMEEVHYANKKLLKEFDDFAKRHDIKYFLMYGGLIGAIRHKDLIPWDDDVDIVVTREEFNKLKPYLDEFKGDFSVSYPCTNNKFFDFVTKINYEKSSLENKNPETEFYNEEHNKISLDIFIFDKTYPGKKFNKQIFKLKMLYGKAISRRYKIDYKKYSFLQKLQVFSLAFLGKFTSLNRIHKKYEKISQKYNNEDTGYYFASNGTINDFDVVFDAKDFEKTTLGIVGDLELPIPYNYDNVLRKQYGNYMEFPPVESQKPLHINYDEIKVERID